MCGSFWPGINNGSCINERCLVLLKKSNLSEIMDDFSIKDERIDLALSELKKINKYLGGEGTSREGFKEIFRKLKTKNIKILDVGSGASSVFLLMQNININFDIYSIDKNIRACRYLKKNSTGIKIICADIFYLPFKDQYFDIVHSSLLFHHFNDIQIGTVLNLLKKISKCGIIINDLRRNYLAFIGIKLLTFFFSKSKMVKNDAPISVCRGFIKKEILTILDSSKTTSFKIKRMWAFRWLIIIYLNDYGL